jgi:putative hydrolase
MIATDLMPPAKAAPPAPADNARVADSLRGIAELLAGQGANPFRCAAYRDAADLLRTMPRPVTEVLAAEGVEGLTRLPRIGAALARTIEQLAECGTTPLLERLRGRHDPEATLASVPGIGRKLAFHIHEQLGLETLADLEAAAWDGRLATVPGLGTGRRLQSIRRQLATLLRRPARTAAGAPRPSEPPVQELLSVDEEYRHKAANNQLTHVAPYRFNPARASWLPILHTARRDRHYTALYSNTARAHRLGTTHDWVVIYRDDPGGHGQWTVVTARHGRRTVRGRERECCLEQAALDPIVELGRRLI